MVQAGKDLSVCVFLPLFLPFRSSVASGQTLIHPDSSAHLPALVWQQANSLIKVPGALLVQLVACKLINRFPVFNSFWECSALLWVVNQAFRAGFFFEKRHGRNSFKCFTVLGSWGRRRKDPVGSAGAACPIYESNFRLLLYFSWLFTPCKISIIHAEGSQMEPALC